MSTRNAKIEVDINVGGCVLLLVILILSLAFCGEPDIHDAVIHRLMSEQAPTTPAPAAPTSASYAP